MQTLLAFGAAGATSKDHRGVCLCVQRLLKQELEKFDLRFFIHDTLPHTVTAASAAARIAILSGRAHAMLIEDGIVQETRSAIVEDTVKTGLRLGTVSLYRAKSGRSETYKP